MIYRVLCDTVIISTLCCISCWWDNGMLKSAAVNCLLYTLAFRCCTSLMPLTIAVSCRDCGRHKVTITNPSTRLASHFRVSWKQWITGCKIWILGW